MEEHQKLIIVPWDFTHVAEYALAHAVKISRMVGNEICLLHIVDAKINHQDFEAKNALLNQKTEENIKKFNIPIAFHISKGTIFNAIADFAHENGHLYLFLVFISEVDREYDIMISILISWRVLHYNKGYF